MKRVDIKTRTPLTNLKSTNRIIVGDVRNIKLSDDDIKRCLRAGARVTVLDKVSEPVVENTLEEVSNVETTEPVVENTLEEVSNVETTEQKSYNDYSRKHGKRR